MGIKSILKRLFLLKYRFGKHKLGYLGSNSSIPLNLTISGKYKNVEIGNNTSIGRGAVFMASNARILISHNVVASHNLTIITGDHERRVGMFCNTITEAIKNHDIRLDQDVVIESDVWLGINVTILKGVTIGRGTTVCAGAVVNKSMPPYCICGGVPARFIKFYWSIDQILEHERLVYPIDKRLTEAQLKDLYRLYEKDC